MNSRSSIEKEDSARASVSERLVVESLDLDVAAQITAGKDLVIDPKEAARVR